MIRKLIRYIKNRHSKCQEKGYEWTIQNVIESYLGDDGMVFLWSDAGIGYELKWSGKMRDIPEKYSSRIDWKFIRFDTPMLYDLKRKEVNLALSKDKIDLVIGEESEWISNGLSKI